MSSHYCPSTCALLFDSFVPAIVRQVVLAGKGNGRGWKRFLDPQGYSTGKGEPGKKAKQKLAEVVN